MRKSTVRSLAFAKPLTSYAIIIENKEGIKDHQCRGACRNAVSPGDRACGCPIEGPLSLKDSYSSCRLKRLRKRSTRPAESRMRWVPVKKGWQFEHTSTFSTGLMLRVLKLLPQAQLTVAST